MYEYVVALIYMFTLHWNRQGQETFSNTQCIKNCTEDILIIIILTYVLFYTDCCLPVPTRN